ncbi:MAG: RhuM family protein, partial [Patescibacteria group bacterium]
AADYDGTSEATKKFFAFVQNKLHFAVTGKTAAEIVRYRSDSGKKHMGLTSWRQSPKGKIIKIDIGVAKNYLNEKELGSLRRIVSAFLDLAEDRATRGIVTTMSQWAEFIDKYLSLGSYKVLQGAGGISHEKAIAHAEKEFIKYRIIQDRAFVSDFDRETQKYLKVSKSAKPKRRKL